MKDPGWQMQPACPLCGRRESVGRLVGQAGGSRLRHGGMRPRAEGGALSSLSWFCARCTVELHPIAQGWRVCHIDAEGSISGSEIIQTVVATHHG